MIPNKQRRSIAAIFAKHGHDIPMVTDTKLANDTGYVFDDVLHGGTRYINWAKDIRDNVFVPELYSGEESTWA